jgi:hypothetical protein
MKLFIVSILTLAACVACKGNDNLNSSRSQQELSDVQVSVVNNQWRMEYGFNENGCATGNQVVFGFSQDQVTRRLCNQLRDEPTNHFCARALRERAFAAHCQAGVNPDRFRHHDDTYDNQDDTRDNRDDRDNRDRD